MYVDRFFLFFLVCSFHIWKQMIIYCTHTHTCADWPRSIRQIQLLKCVCDAAQKTRFEILYAVLLKSELKRELNSVCIAHAKKKRALEILTRAKSINSIDLIWHSGFVQKQWPPAVHVHCVSTSVADCSSSSSSYYLLAAINYRIISNSKS